MKNPVKISRNKPFRSGIGLSALAMALLAQPGTAWAQEEEPADDEDIIVVTGTLLRGIAPAGAQSLNIGSEVVEATGATSTDELLASIPQISSFGQLQTVNAGGTQLTVNRINLRNLPQGIGGSSPTLVLMDGHRLVSVGVRQAYPDPDVIPPLLIQRVDVLTDGGSAIYGSDAVGGVVNFITRDSYDGVKADFRQGFGDDYYSTDANLLVGHTWSTGSAFIAYNYARHSALQGGDRDYIQNINYDTGLPAPQSCSPANAVVNGVTFAVVGGTSLQQGNANLCDRSQFESYYPEEQRHSGMVGFRQDLSDTLEFGVKAYFSERRNKSFNGPIDSQATLTAANPNYISTNGVDMSNQTVLFDFGPVGAENTVRTELWALGITPTLTWQFGNDWQAKAMYNYGKSETKADDPGVNDAVLGAAVAAGTINPYDIASSDPATLARVLDFTNFGIGRDELHNARLIVDGPLFQLPGGEMRVAVGGEFIHERYEGFTIQAPTVTARTSTPVPASRDVWSAFGELNLPLVGPQNDIPLVHSLTVSAAVRYDDYSDFGSNWAPNLGATWKPIDWIGFRGRWNKSFQAPSLVQISQASSPIVGVNPGFIVAFVPLLRNPDVPPNGGPIVSIQGTVSPLDPQKSEAYNLGVDISPPFIDGLDLYFTYFDIKYEGQISSPPLGFGQFYGVPTFEPLFIMLPTDSELQNFLSSAGVPADTIANALARVAGQGGNPYIVADVRSRNLGLTYVDGFDIGFNYRRDTSFGSIHVNMGGTYVDTNVTASDGVNFQPNQAGIDNNPKFVFTSRLGADIGSYFRTQLTWRHRDGFDLSVPAQQNQMKVGSFDVFDLFMEYNLEPVGIPQANVSLNIQNLFDQDPPLLRARTSSTLGGYWNGSTVGRVVQVGLGIEF